MKKIKEHNGRIEGRKQGWETLCRSAIMVERCKYLGASGRENGKHHSPQMGICSQFGVKRRPKWLQRSAYKTEVGDEGPEVGDEGPEAGDKAHRSFWSWKEI